MSKSIIDLVALQKFRQLYDKRLKDGKIIPSKSRTAQQLENVSDESGDYQETPFNFQATGTDDNTTSTPSAPVFKHLQLRGNCVKFSGNLLRNYRFDDGDNSWSLNNSTVSVNDNVATITKSGAESLGGVIYQSISGLLTTRKYFISCYAKSNDGTNVSIHFGITGSTSGNITASTTSQEWTRLSLVTSPANANDSLCLRVGSSSTPIGVSGDFANVVCIDVTDIELTRNKTYSNALEFIRDYSLPYYGRGQKIIYQTTNKLITTERNQFSALDTDIEVINGSWYRLTYGNASDELANISSGSVKEYDGAKNLIKETAYGDLVVLYGNASDYVANDGLKGLKLDDNTRYVQLSGIAQTKIMFELAWDGLQTGYQVKTTREYDLPTMNKPYSVSKDIYNYVGADGLEHDVVDRLDLSQRTWSYNEYGYYRSEVISDIETPSSSFVKANIIADKYNAVREADAGTNGDIFITTGGRIWVKDSNQSGNPSGYLYYKKSSVSTTQLSSFAENVEGHDYGTMRFVSTQTESASNPIAPQGNQFFYPADYVALIDDLNNYLGQNDASVNDIALKSDLASDKTELQGIDAQLQNALGGTLRHCLAIQESGLNFEDTDFVDFGTLTWNYNPNNGLFYVSGISSIIELPSSNDDVAKVICSSYQTTTRNLSTTTDKSVAISLAGEIVIRDSSYNNADTFKSAMKGILLAYEKAS